MDDIEQEQAPAHDGTYSSDSSGIREAAEDLTRKRTEHGTPVEASGEPFHIATDHDPDPIIDVTYQDGRPADEPVEIRQAARDLAQYRRETRAQQEQELADILDEQTAHAVEQRPEQRPEQGQQPEHAQPTEADQRASVEQVRQLYEQGLGFTLHQLRAVAAAEFSDVRSRDDLFRLATQEPQRFLRLQQLDASWRESAKNAQMAMAHRQEEAAQSFKEFASRNDEIAAEKIPETRSAEKAQFEEQALQMLGAHGFSRDELRASWTGKDTFSLRDHRVQEIVAAATRWFNAQTKARNVQARQPPPVQRPGVSGAINRNVSDLGELSSRLSRTGSLKDAVRLRAAQNAAKGR